MSELSKNCFNLKGEKLFSALARLYYFSGPTKTSMLRRLAKNKNTGTLCATGIINPAMSQLVMCRFLEFFADIMYIPSGVIFYHAVKPNEKFGLLLL